MQHLQPVQSKPPVDHVDAVDTAFDHRSHTAGSDDLDVFRLAAELFAHLLLHAFDHVLREALVTVDQAGLHALGCVFGNKLARDLEVYVRQFRGVLKQSRCLCLHARRDSSAQECPVSGYAVEGSCCAEVHDDEVAAVSYVGCDRVYQTVCSKSTRILVFYLDSGLDALLYDYRILVVELQAHVLEREQQRRYYRRDDDVIDVLFGYIDASEHRSDYCAVLIR